VMERYLKSIKKILKNRTRVMGSLLSLVEIPRIKADKSKKRRRQRKMGKKVAMGMAKRAKKKKN
jgi:hypothetical protein